MNKAVVIGRLGRDPELRATQSGQSVTNFTVATNENYKDGNGERQERTEWHNIVVWGKQAESCAKYLKKGRQVAVDGRLQSRSYDDREGVKRHITEIVASRVEFLGDNGNGNGKAEEPTEGDGKIF
jgi:single-strand DNA-binding protein